MENRLEEGRAGDRETCSEAFVVTERNDVGSDGQKSF